MLMKMQDWYVMYLLNRKMIMTYETEHGQDQSQRILIEQYT